MGKKLAGVTFIRRGIDLDYCFEAAIKSMQAVCDIVCVCYCESQDGTLEVLQQIGGNLQILFCNEEMWQSQKGKEKLSFFQNVAIEHVEKEGYEYILLVQCDECIHQDSIPIIKRALELNEESYYCSRYNLWGTAQTMLNVPQNRKPVSTVVNRLAKSYYRSVDDGESLATSSANLDFINLIEIFHLGFIRDPTKHIAKIKEIQGNIFGMDYDKRADLKPEFDWKDWGFTEKDLIPIPKELPIFIKDLAKQRDETNSL